jgi:hypothetical protein
MKNNDQISYYCFNKVCKGSVYYDSIQIIDLPFNAHTLTTEHYCSLCKSKLTSAMDISLSQAIAPKRPAPILAA